MSKEYKYNLKDNVIVFSNKKYINKVVCERIKVDKYNYYLLYDVYVYTDTLLYDVYLQYIKEEDIISIKEYRKLKLQKINNKNYIVKIFNKIFHK